MTCISCIITAVLCPAATEELLYYRAPDKREKGFMV